MNIEIANDKKFFYQWDTGQMLQITDDGSGSEVHLEKDTLTLACAIREENGARLVDVPDLLLQVDGHLTAYLVHKVEDEVETLFSKTFRIKHRAKPEDYVCTETEILRYRDLAERITALEQNGGGTGGGIAQESDPTVPAWAKNPNKPTYTAAEVGALPADTKIPTVPDKVSAFTNDTGYVTAEDLPTVPAALPNPNKLTFSGAVEAEYDGSSAVEVVIPAGGGSAKEWRLINTYTIETEDFAKLYFNTDMDGNPFELTELWIVGDGTNATTHSASTQVGVFFRFGDGTHGPNTSQSYFDMAANAVGLAYQRGFLLWFDLLTDTMGRYLSAACGNQLTNGNFQYAACSPSRNGNGKLDTIREIAIFPSSGSVLYGLGTVISIYGR